MVCPGDMAAPKLDAWADKAAATLAGREIETLVVGTKMSGLLAGNEELLLADGGSSQAEPFKPELNREVGKSLCALTGKTVEEVYTQFENSLQSITTPSPGKIDDFMKRLQDKLDEQLETAPVNSTIEKVF